VRLSSSRLKAEVPNCVRYAEKKNGERGNVNGKKYGSHWTVFSGLKRIDATPGRIVNRATEMKYSARARFVNFQSLRQSGITVAQCSRFAPLLLNQFGHKPEPARLILLSLSYRLDIAATL
jgi:hypothetical protein